MDLEKTLKDIYETLDKYRVSHPNQYVNRQSKAIKYLTTAKLRQEVEETKRHRAVMAEIQRQRCLIYD